jgi:phosphoribosylglycinamide formyltransferase-1
MHRIAIFASGAGSNARVIIDYFRHIDSVQISLVVCNKPGAGVIEIAEKENIPVILLEREKFFRGNHYLDELTRARITFIVLAGFLWKMPKELTSSYQGKIINIHPALLPSYGGKGMYGSFVHEAVINAKEKVSGISIHFVDEEYDHGNLIFQASCSIDEGETASSLARKIQELEHYHYPRVLEEVLREG